MDFADHAALARSRDDPTLERELEASVSSAALARLLGEVRGADQEVARAYNRTYNRHNR